MPFFSLALPLLYRTGTAGHLAKWDRLVLRDAYDNRMRLAGVRVRGR